MGFKIRSISGVGEYSRTLYIWDTEDGFYCQAGCFFGLLFDFKTAVVKKYGEASAYEKAADFLCSEWGN